MLDVAGQVLAGLAPADDLGAVGRVGREGFLAVTIKRILILMLGLAGSWNLFIRNILGLLSYI